MTQQQDLDGGETPVYTVQVAVDATDPHALADWWAAALGWQVEEQDAAFITSMIDQGYATDADTLHHNGALVWAIGAAIRHPDGLTRAPRILFQAVPEAKSVKNRVHLDLVSSEQPTTAEVERLLAHGARREGSTGHQGPHHWLVLIDPEGNEFCLTVPPPG